MADELEDAFRAAAAEAEAAFGNGTLYVEKCVVSRRGTSRSRCSPTRTAAVLTLGERECSIQRRHQKLIEESPSPALDAAAREAMEAAAEAASRAIGYRNAGTFEFLRRARRRLLLHRAERAPSGRASGDASSCSGIDLVREQLGSPRARRSRSRPGAAARPRDRDAASTPRTRAATSHPRPAGSTRCGCRSGPGVRFDTHVEAGAVIPPQYDSLLAKLVVWDEDRPAAVARALRALGELEVRGVPTTRELAIDVLRSEEFAEGRYSTGFLEQAAGRLPALVA